MQSGKGITITSLPRRADDTGEALAKHMRVDLRRAYIGMPQQ